MKMLLVNGQVIRQQIWISFNDRSKAIDIRSLFTKGYSTLRHYLFATVPEDSEFVWTEEITLEELALLLKIFAFYHVAKTSLAFMTTTPSDHSNRQSTLP